jgi:hypothetical protein
MPSEIARLGCLPIGDVAGDDHVVVVAQRLH